MESEDGGERCYLCAARTALFKIEQRAGRAGPRSLTLCGPCIGLVYRGWTDAAR